MVAPDAPRRRPTRLLGHRPQPPPLLPPPDEPAPRRRARRDRSAAPVRRPARRGAATARSRSRTAAPGTARGRRTHRGDHHRDRRSVLPAGPDGGGRADAGRDAARGRRHLPGTLGGRQRPLERLPRLPAPGGPAERAGRLVVRGARREVGPRRKGHGAAAGSPVLGPAGGGAGHGTGVDAPGARRRRRAGPGELPGRGVRGVLPRRPPAVRSPRRRTAGDLPGAGRPLHGLRLEAGLRGPAPRRRPPVARRRHHARSAAPAGRA